MRELDADRSGDVDFKEFKNWWRNFLCPRAPPFLFKRRVVWGVVWEAV